MIVVRDTSPLSYAHQLGLLPILHSLYGEIVIPPAVEHELHTSLLHTLMPTSTLSFRADLRHYKRRQRGAPKRRGSP
jgi:predicted nucleic acid-binding protein